MQSQLTPTESNLQPQNSSLQQGQAGLQQTGEVSTNDNSSSLLSQQPPTNQLQVAQQGQPAPVPPPVASNNVPVGLWFLFAMSFLFIAIGLWLRWRSNKTTPQIAETVVEEVPAKEFETPVVKPAKSSKPKKKQSRKKRAAKR